MLSLARQFVQQSRVLGRLLLAQHPQPHPRTLSKRWRFHLQWRRVTTENGSPYGSRRGCPGSSCTVCSGACVSKVLTALTVGAVREPGDAAPEEVLTPLTVSPSGTAGTDGLGEVSTLPRLLKGRARGPVFITHRKPGPGKVLAPRDVCPDTGLVRLSYGQARMLLDEHTALGGKSGTGWDLHEWRHSGLTHLGEAGASLLMLRAKSRHKEPGNVWK
ncbi:hypothetical protein QF030_000736 [Streptomyces rishiriensis]|uniref:Uncharacterized protein n=1 Tax=Streptomyces rishiriensis TaxID=68264 RepID=A0ABU0NIK5_STRRH|nr:hypothetical protein [Streptomyces rishiriensis]